MKAASIPLCLPTSPEAMSVDIVTFGCRLNAFESEVIAREAENAGLTDTIVINSCAVTNEAVAQARQAMAPHLVAGFQRGLPRVFVQVQNGCDHRCTFCIIPYGRGNSRSVPMGGV